MLQALTMTFREGLGAFLVVAVLLAFFHRVKAEHLRAAVKRSAALSVLTSLLAGVLFARAGNQAFWEGVLALGSVSLLLLLGALLFPAFSLARQNGQRISCASNLRQLGLAFTQYREDFDGEMPMIAFTVTADYSFPNGSNPTAPGQMHALWMHEIYTYVKNTQVYNCPNADGIYSGGYFWRNGEPSYGFNYYLNRNINPDLSILKYPAKTALIADCNYYIMSPDPNRVRAAINPDNNNPPLPRHLEMLNMTFMDGHVKPVQLDDWQSEFKRGETGAITDPVWARYDPRLQK